MDAKIMRLFHKACANYSLLEEGDKILVGLSGGKDSLLLVELLGLQQRILKPKINVEAAHVIMDNINYESHHDYLQQFCEQRGVKLHILHTSFDASTDKRKTPCFLCSWNRRKTLFRFATDNGFNKIALGHHQDDFLHTYLMNITFEGSASTMTPAMKMRQYPLTVIRPLCLLQEPAIKEYATAQEYKGEKITCPYDKETRRHDIKRLFAEMERLNPEARYSMWHAIQSNFQKQEE